MKKSEFLEKLRRRLVVLNEEEIDDIIAEYEQFIAEKKKKGKSEAEAIKEFGDFDELVKEILSAYKIKDNNNDAKNVVMNFFNDVGKVFERIAENLSTKNFNQIMRFMLEVFLLIIIIAILKWPVNLIISLGRDIFSILPTPFFQLFAGLWRFILEIGYLILAILFFIKIFKERFLKNMSGSEPKTRKKTAKAEKNIGKVIEDTVDEIEKEIINEFKTDKKVTVKKRKEEPTESLDNIFIITLKIFAFFILMPTFFTIMGLMIVLFLGIGLLISGVYYIGVLLILLAMVWLAIMIAELLFRFIFSLKISGIRVFVNFLIGMVLLGIGVTVTTFEVANTTFINNVPKDFETMVVTKTFNANDVDRFLYRPRNYEFIVDENLEDEIKIVVEYYRDFTTPRISVENRFIEIYYRHNRIFPDRKIYDSIIRNLRNREIHNYFDLHGVTIKIYANSETIARLDKNFDEYIRDQEMRDILHEKERIIQERSEWEQKYWDLFYESN